MKSLTSPASVKAPLSLGRTTSPAFAQNLVLGSAIGLFLLSACGRQSNQALAPKPAEVLSSAKAIGDPAPKNIIFLVGDGMGLSQITAGMYANGNKIAMERMSYVGLHKSHSSDNLVTDSAAGATAFSCGVKTYNGAIGVKEDSSACETLLELADQYQMQTGLVASSSIVHATPASFFAHQGHRSSYEAIAAQIPDSPVDFFVGGGEKHFARRSEDSRDLVAEMRAAGWQLESFFDKGIQELKADPSRRFGYFTANEEPLMASQGRDYLKPASIMAMDYLESRDQQNQGFFLLIEGSQIDWGGHANNSEYIISEVIDFSNTLDAVLDFAAKDGQTLVVVTADHETGGYAIQTGSRQDSIIGAFTSGSHTAAMIPVFAFGPGAESFAGIYENTAIYEKLRALMTLGRTKPVK